MFHVGFNQKLLVPLPPAAAVTPSVASQLWHKSLSYDETDKF